MARSTNHFHGSAPPTPAATLSMTGTGSGTGPRTVDCDGAGTAAGGGFEVVAPLTAPG